MILNSKKKEAAKYEHSDRHDMSPNETAKGHEGSQEGARAYRGRPGAGPASEIKPCIEIKILHTLLRRQIEQQRHMSNLTDTI